MGLDLTLAIDKFGFCHRNKGLKGKEWVLASDVLTVWRDGLPHRIREIAETKAIPLPDWVEFEMYGDNGCELPPP